LVQPGPLRQLRPRLGGLPDQLHELREERPRAPGLLTRAAEERELLAALHRRRHGRNDLLAVDLPALQVALQERVVRGGDRLEELRPPRLELVPQLLRNVRLLVLPRLRIRLVDVRLAAEQVDDPAEAVPRADGDL